MLRLSAVRAKSLEEIGPAIEMFLLDEPHVSQIHRLAMLGKVNCDGLVVCKSQATGLQWPLLTILVTEGGVQVADFAQVVVLEVICEVV